MKPTHETLTQGARRTGVDPQLLRRLIHNDVLPTSVWCRLGRRFYLNRLAFDEFLEKGGAGLPDGGWRLESQEQARVSS